MGTCWFLRIISERLSARHLHRAAELDGSAYYYYVRHALLRMRASMGCHAKVDREKSGPVGPVLRLNLDPSSFYAESYLLCISPRCS